MGLYSNSVWSLNCYFAMMIANFPQRTFSVYIGPKDDVINDKLSTFQRPRGLVMVSLQKWFALESVGSFHSQYSHILHNDPISLMLKMSSFFNESFQSTHKLLFKTIKRLRNWCQGNVRNGFWYGIILILSVPFNSICY